TADDRLTCPSPALSPASATKTTGSPTRGLSYETATVRRGLTLRGKTVLITGGTGSFGTKLLEVLLERHEPEAVRIFSRDELKQSELRRRFADDDDRVRYLIGDVRDLPRLARALRGVDVVVHAAA